MAATVLVVPYEEVHACWHFYLRRLGEGCYVEPQGVSVCKCIESNVIVLSNTDICRTSLHWLDSSSIPPHRGSAASKELSQWNDLKSAEHTLQPWFELLRVLLLQKNLQHLTFLFRGSCNRRFWILKQLKLSVGSISRYWELPDLRDDWQRSSQSSEGKLPHTKWYMNIY